MLSAQYNDGYSKALRKWDIFVIIVVWYFLVQHYLLCENFHDLLSWKLGMNLYDCWLALQSGLILKRLGILKAFAQQDKGRLAMEDSFTP